LTGSNKNVITIPVVELSKTPWILFLLAIALIFLVSIDDYSKRVDNVRLTSALENTTIERDDYRDQAEKLQFRLDNFPCDATASTRDSVGGLASSVGTQANETKGYIAAAANAAGETVQKGGDLLKTLGQLAGLW